MKPALTIFGRLLAIVILLAAGTPLAILAVLSFALLLAAIALVLGAFAVAAIVGAAVALALGLGDSFGRSLKSQASDLFDRAKEEFATATGQKDAR